MKVYQPQISAVLFKRRDRTMVASGAYAAARFRSVKTLDLTPLIAEDGVRTSKSLRSAAGSWQLVLEARPASGDLLDHAYGLIEPMDFIEIRATRARTGALPLLMRGFVSQVTMTTSIDGGMPQRKIIVAGWDMGLVLQNLRLHFQGYAISPEQAEDLKNRFGLPFGLSTLAQFESFTTFTGSQATSTTPAELLSNVISGLVNPYLEKLFEDERFAGLRSMAISEDAALIDGVVPPVGGTSEFEGRNVHEVLSSLLDVGTWNELFLEDRDADGLVLVARMAPWKYARPAVEFVSLNGDLTDANYIQAGASARTVDIDAGNIISMNVTRSDSGVANFFWVQARFDLVNDGLRRLDGAGGDGASYVLDEWPNADPTSFGWRFMNAQTSMSPATAAAFSPTAEELPGRVLSMEEWLSKRRAVLRTANQDNSVLESGSMTVQGDAALVPGVYMRVQLSSMSMEVYVVQVTHEYSVGNGFTSTIAFERGTGFVSRAVSNAAPWLLERDERGVS